MRIIKTITRKDSVNTLIKAVQTDPKTYRVLADIGGEIVWCTDHRTESAAIKAADRLHMEMRERYGE